MAYVIRGKEVADKIRENLIRTINENNLTPCLGIVRVGEKDSDLAYERGIRKTCDLVGINVEVFSYNESIDQEKLENEFKKINANSDIHGILLFKPLPKYLDSQRLENIISPEKDVDCIGPDNWAKLASGQQDGYYPCTAEAVFKILEHENFNISGANAVIIGRSNVIGKPLGLLLLSKNATVTWCHSKTADIAERCLNADILVSACGVANLIDKKICNGVKENCIAIDVGMNFVDGKMCGDFNFEEVSEVVGKITPVPGGVGAVTNTVLAEHVVRAALKSSMM